MRHWGRQKCVHGSKSWLIHTVQAGVAATPSSNHSLLCFESLSRGQTRRRVPETSPRKVAAWAILYQVGRVSSYLTQPFAQAGCRTNPDRDALGLSPGLESWASSSTTCEARIENQERLAVVSRARVYCGRVRP